MSGQALVVRVAQEVVAPEEVDVEEVVVKVEVKRDFWGRQIVEVTDQDGRRRQVLRHGDSATVYVWGKRL